MRNALSNFSELRDAVIPTLAVCAIAVLTGAAGTLVALALINL